jgi:uncharacterized protein (DUF486 family)
MPAALTAALLLVLSNAFMTYAWYGHLRDLAGKPWYLVAIVAWGVAFFEYQLQVPANRIGYSVMTLPQLKILQEVISLAVFVPFSLLYMRAPLSLDYLWAGFCLLGAAYFLFRGAGA